jgi:hypothetical protein
MAARNVSPTPAEPKPAEPKPANRHRQQRKPEYPSVTAANYRKTEKDVAKLIDCLADWKRDLRAARSAAPEVPPRRSRSCSNAPRVVPTVSLTPFYPRGNPLTESMEFTDRDGAVWLAYIEGAQLAPGKQRGRASALPDRHLRFDSAAGSRFTSLVPAGSPFLAEARLQSLLDEAQPDLPVAVTTGSPARALSNPGYRVNEWSTRAVESGREAIADWSRRWQQTAGRSEALRRHVLELLSGAANTMHGMVEVLLGHRPARP